MKPKNCCCYLSLLAILFAALAGCTSGATVAQQQQAPTQQSAEVHLMQERTLATDMASYSADILLNALNFAGSGGAASVSAAVTKDLPVFPSGTISTEVASVCSSGSAALNGSWKFLMRPLACGVQLTGSLVFDHCMPSTSAPLIGLPAGSIIDGSIDEDVIAAFPCEGITPPTEPFRFGDLVTPPNDVKLWVFSKSGTGLSVIAADGAASTLAWLNFEALFSMTDGTTDIKLTDAKIDADLCVGNVAGGYDCGPDQQLQNFFCPYGENCQLGDVGDQACDALMQKQGIQEASCLGDPLQQYGCCVDFTAAQNTCHPSRWECADGSLRLYFNGDTLSERYSTFVCNQGQIQPFICLESSDCRNGAECGPDHQCSCAVKPLPQACDGICDAADLPDVQSGKPGACPQDCCGDGVCEVGEDDSSCGIDCTCSFDGVCQPHENASSCLYDCHCGDGICETKEMTGGIIDETADNCPQDCSVPPPPPPCTVDSGDLGLPPGTPLSCTELGYGACEGATCGAAAGCPLGENVGQPWPAPVYLTCSLASTVGNDILSMGCGADCCASIASLFSLGNATCDIGSGCCVPAP